MVGGFIVPLWISAKHLTQSLELADYRRWVYP